MTIKFIIVILKTGSRPWAYHTEKNLLSRLKGKSRKYNDYRDQRVEM